MFATVLDDLHAMLALSGHALKAVHDKRVRDQCPIHSMLNMRASAAYDLITVYVP